MAALLAFPITIALALGMAAAVAAFMRPFAVYANYYMPYEGPTPDVLVTLLHRGDIDVDTFVIWMRRLGYGAKATNMFLMAGQTRLSPDEIVRLRMRDEIDEDAYVLMLRDHGITSDVAFNMLLAAQFYPGAPELVTWMAREVFEEKSVEKYGLDDEFDKLDLKPFAKAGVSEEQAKNYWRAHWQHPPFNQVAEMMHRDILRDARGRAEVIVGSEKWQRERVKEEAELYEWYRLVEIPPYWRDKLTALAYQPYTRVDARRMYDMRVLDKIDLRRNFLDLGYDEKHAENMTVWTMIDAELIGLVNRVKKGWMSSEDALDTLTGIGLSKTRAIELLQEKLKEEDFPEGMENAVAQARELVLTGVDKGNLTQQAAAGLLVKMGNTPEQAAFIVSMRVESRGSPETPLEYAAVAEAMLAATRRGGKPIPAELMAAERAHLAAKADAATARTTKAEPSVIDALDALERTAYRRFKLLSQQHGI